MIYNVEVSSALYVMSFSLDEDLIAVPSTEGEKVKGEEELEKQRELRVKVAIQALYSVLTGNFGGKKSRFLPSMKLMSGVVTVTDFPFVPEPGHSNDYVKTTMQRLSKAQGIFNGKGKAYVINNEGVEEGQGAVKVSNVEELVEKLMGK
jgi:CRISPR-associated autoregulator, Csa2 family